MQDYIQRCIDGIPALTETIIKSVQDNIERLKYGNPKGVITTVTTDDSPKDILLTIYGYEDQEGKHITVSTSYFVDEDDEEAFLIDPVGFPGYERSEDGDLEIHKAYPADAQSVGTEVAALLKARLDWGEEENIVLTTYLM